MKTTLIGMLLIGLSCSAQTGGFTAQLETTPGKILNDEYWATFKVTLSTTTSCARCRSGRSRRGWRTRRGKGLSLRRILPTPARDPKGVMP